MPTPNLHIRKVLQICQPDPDALLEEEGLAEHRHGRTVRGLLDVVSRPGLWGATEQREAQGGIAGDGLCKVRTEVLIIEAVARHTRQVCLPLGKKVHRSSIKC